ncbi:hypothetical protein [uncultured Barnesiella sp.]|uniref:hypothetical protein n=1 Tax=uncultured Barnesiella sp. TaxID=584861 RepID=UPI0026389F80|nr:hypothetical protein [uncultured Barnesiella sp.]
METKEKEEVKVRIKVLQPFRDKFNKSVRYEVGQELEFETTRAEDVVTRELAEYADPIG